MIELYQLQQLVAIANCGTISKAAEQLHISQPALSRSMQKLETALQVRLFDRQKNRIRLNQTGLLAVEQGQQVLQAAGALTEQVRAFDRSLHTLSIGACAPAPLWELLPIVTQLYPGLTVTSEMKELPQLLMGMQNGAYQCAILPFAQQDPALCSLPFERERLYFALPPDHPLAAADSLYFHDLDGENILLLSQIGFWRQVCREKMPHSRALVQTAQEDFQTLTKASALPFFVSDLTIKWAGRPTHRAIIPILDPEAEAQYYLVCNKAEKKRWTDLFERLLAGISEQ